MEADQVFVGGPARLAESFDAVETVRSVLAILEQQLVVVTLLRDVLDRGLSVAIGTEHGFEPLSSCAVVVAPVSIDGQDLGAVGLLGPTRMDYARAMAAAHVVGERLGPTHQRGARWPSLTGWATSTRCSASAPTPATTRSSGPTAPAPASCIPTPTTATPPPRRASRRSPSPTRSCATPSGGPATTASAPRVCSVRRPAAAGGFGFEGGLGDIFEAFFGQMGGTGSRRRGPQVGRRRRGAARSRVRRGRVRRPQGDLRPPSGHVRDLRGQGHGRRDRAGHLHRLPGHRRAAPGAPVAAGPGRDERRLLALQRDRRDDPQPVRRLPRRGAPHGGEHVHGGGARRRRGGVDPAARRSRRRRPARRPERIALRAPGRSLPTRASSARPTTCTPR